MARISSSINQVPAFVSSSLSDFEKHHPPLFHASFKRARHDFNWIGRSKHSHNSNIRCNAYANDVSTQTNTEWFQKVIQLNPYPRGCHIITEKIYREVPEVKNFHTGLANLFVMHTSASLTINENASPDVPLDMEDSLNRIAPEGNHYRHLDEGYDDMPAHVKSSMMGCSLTIPIRAGRFCLGIWQGIWLNEHRNYGGPRQICITIQGVKRPDGRVYP